MADETTPGVLLKAADGSYYFIPHSNLSSYELGALPPSLDVDGQVATNVPRLDAFDVQRVTGVTDADTAASMPTPEAGPDAAAYMPTPEGGPAHPEA